MAVPSTPRLELDDVTVRFGVTTAVDSVSLAVEPGEAVAIVGPSGCGKSTLLRTVVGLQELDAGTIRVDGNDIGSVPTHKRGIGLMFQDHALFEHRSVAENIGFGLEMHKMPAAAQTARIDELMALVGLSGFGDRPIPTLSGGEAQRVALARSLAPTPHILLLDEPLGALDQQRRESLVVELHEVLRSVGQTVLYVTHDLEEAAVIADRIAIMNAGAIERVDTPDRLWADPQSEFVARFIGLNVVDSPNGRVALASNEFEVAQAGDDATQAIQATAAASWFHDGTWTVAGATDRGERIRWETPEPPSDGDTVPLLFHPSAHVRAVSASPRLATAEAGDR